MDLSQVILQHILSTVLVIFAGFLIGGGLGLLFAWLFRQLIRAVPGLRLPFMVLPWRTLIFTLVLFFISHMAILVVPSISQGLSAVVYPVIGFSLLVLFIVGDEALSQWLPLSPFQRWAGLTRTFAVAAGVFVAISFNAAGEGILVYAQSMFTRTFRPDAYWITLGIVMGLGLFFDLLLGMVQILLAKPPSRLVITPASLSGDH
jgi:hypothetical protein